MSSYAHVVHTTAKQVISRRRKNENVFKMSKDEICTCKACKNTVFHCQICKFMGFLLPSSSWLLKLPTVNYSPPLRGIVVYYSWFPDMVILSASPIGGDVNDRMGEASKGKSIFFFSLNLYVKWVNWWCQILFCFPSRKQTKKKVSNIFIVWKTGFSFSDAFDCLFRAQLIFSFLTKDYRKLLWLV